MSNRYRNWQENLCKDLLQSKKKRKLYFESLREEYSDDLEVIRAIVKVMGLKEFSELCNLSPSNVSNYLKEGKDLKLSTIRKLLTPFGVKQAKLPIGTAA